MRGRYVVMSIMAFEYGHHASHRGHLFGKILCCLQNHDNIDEANVRLEAHQQCDTASQTPAQLALGGNCEVTVSEIDKEEANGIMGHNVRRNPEPEVCGAAPQFMLT